jgi:hypothetical protein
MDISRRVLGIDIQPVILGGGTRHSSKIKIESCGFHPFGFKPSDDVGATTINRAGRIADWIRPPRPAPLRIGEQLGNRTVDSSDVCHRSIMAPPRG